MVRIRALAIALFGLLSPAAIGQMPKSSDTARPVATVTVGPFAPGELPADQCLPSPPLATVIGSGPQDRFWFQADYLAWRLSGAQLPPLVTASPPGTPRAQAGVLGAPGTVVLVGDETVNDDYRSGVRVRVGAWLDECRTTGFEVRALVLDRQSFSSATGSPDGSLIISRPFFDARAGRPNAELVSFPGVLAGTVFLADAESDKFWAVDAVCRKSLCRDCTGFIDVLAGYRYLQFGDRVRVIERLTPLATPGAQINLVDEFNASNRFHGGVVGIVAGFAVDMVSVELQARVGVGRTTRDVDISGATQIIAPGLASTTGTGGLLAQSTNIGVFRSSDWTVVPDLELTVGCWLTGHCRVLVGCSVLYWPGVARAGEQIDFAVNPSQLPPGTLVGPARPAFSLSRSDLWAHGLSVGVEIRY
jgi:Putative beta barrel porin-7 (BBP7)